MWEKQGYSNLAGLFLTEMFHYFKDKFYSRLNDKYYHKHGDEFNFLDIFNDTHIKSRILNMKNKYKCYSFNTEDEYRHILEEIKN